jgi:hypothetical protein
MYSYANKSYRLWFVFVKNESHLDSLVRRKNKLFAVTVVLLTYIRQVTSSNPDKGTTVLLLSSFIAVFFGRE